MEKSDLLPVIAELCELQERQFQFSQNLLIGSIAIQQLLEEQGHPDFVKAWQARIRHLENAEIGKQIAQDTRAFGQAIQRVKDLLA